MPKEIKRQPVADWDSYKGLRGRENKLVTVTIGYPPMPTHELVTTAQAFVMRSPAEWQREDTLREFAHGILDPRDPLRQMQATVLEQQGPESETVLRVLTADLDSFTPTTQLFGSPRVLEWICKITLARQAMTFMDIYTTNSPLSQAAQRYQESYANQVDILAQTVEKLSASDLVPIILLVDNLNIFERTISQTKNQISKENPLQEVVFDESRQKFQTIHLVAAQKLRDLRITQFREFINNGWRRVSRWTERGFAQTLDVFPDLKSYDVQLALLEKLLEYARDPDERSNLAETALTYSPKGLLAIARLRDPFLKRDGMQQLIKDMGPGYRATDLVKIAPLLPTCALVVMDYILAKQDARTFARFLEGITDVAQDREAKQLAAILFTYKAEKPSHDKVLEQAFVSLAYVSEEAKAIRTGKAAGFIYLLPDMKIVVSTKRMQNAFLLYESPLQGEPVTLVPERQNNPLAEKVDQKPNVKKTEGQPKPEPNEKLDLAGLGTVGVVTDSRVDAILSTLPAAATEPDKDLDYAWRASPNVPEQVVVIPSLQLAGRARAAGNLGIRAVYTDGESFHFVLDRSITRDTVGNGKVALRAGFDVDGTFAIQGAVNPNPETMQQLAELCKEIQIRTCKSLGKDPDYKGFRELRDEAVEKYTRAHLEDKPNIAEASRAGYKIPVLLNVGRGHVLSVLANES